VPMPDYVSDGRRYMIWWGEHSALDKQKGYVCASPQDLKAIKHTVDLRAPGQGTDPFADKRFLLVQSFGREPNEMDVFQFDFTMPN